MRPVSLWGLLGLLVASLVEAQGKLGVDFTPKLIRITDGIYAYEGPLALPGEAEVVRTNSLVIVTDEGVIVVDGQDSVNEAERMLAAIAEVTPLPVRYLVNASPHGDHVNGNAAFSGARIVAHRRARQAMRSRKTTMPLPELVYDERMTLHLGGKRIVLLYFGPAHTVGDTVVYLPDEKIAFLSEIYFNGVFTSLGDGFAAHHLEVLDAVRSLDAEWFIPGHGIIEAQSADDLGRGLARYRENVKTVYDAVSRHVARGDSLETTLSAMDADLGAFTQLPFYHFLKKRTVEATYRALSTKSSEHK